MDNEKNLAGTVHVGDLLGWQAKPPLAAGPQAEEARMCETFGRVKKTIIAVIGSAERDVVEMATLDDLGINSIDILELGMALEDEFAVVIMDEYLFSSATVGDLVTTIHKSQAHCSQRSDPAEVFVRNEGEAGA
tara:strand:+ start:444 stop:845 length:402 start_codon:yes stop_codon:yes gene_type:complete